MLLYHLNVTLHLFAAVFWLGGMFFFAAVGAPVLRKLEDPGLRAALFERLGTGFRTTGWAAIALLLATGVANLHFRGLLSREIWTSADYWATPAGRFLAAKLLLVAAMLVIQALHDFVLGPRASRLDPGTPGARTARRWAAWLARANGFLGILLLYVAVRLTRG